MKTKQILLLSILIAVATPWITLHAQSGRGPLPLAPPPDAEEADMQAIPDLPDDFESSSAELGNLAGAAVEIMQLQFEAAAVGQDVVQEMQETPGGWDVIREMREAPGKHGLETDRYNMMVYHFLDGLPFNPEPQEYVTKFYLMVQGIAAEADTFIGMMPFGHYSGPPLAPPRDAEEAEMQVAANLPDDFDTNADELEAAGRVADEIAQLQDEGRIDDVLGRRAPVDVLARSRAALLELGQERHEGMIALLVAVANPAHIEPLDITGLADRLRGFLRDQADVRGRLGERRLDVEHALNPFGLAENLTDFRSRKLVFE